MGKDDLEAMNKIQLFIDSPEFGVWISQEKE